MSANWGLTTVNKSAQIQMELFSALAEMILSFSMQHTVEVSCKFFVVAGEICDVIYRLPEWGCKTDRIQQFQRRKS